MFPNRFHFHSPRVPLTVSTLPPDCFLSDVAVYQVGEDEQLHGTLGLPIENVARSALSSGSAEVETHSEGLLPDSAAAIAIPVHRLARVVSVIVLSARQLCEQTDDVVGVFEVWEPLGVYQELALKDGYYGRMERFRNVSSFVRFELGTGLPGQVWQNRCGVIHDDLANHPGFLRAAGASADLLVTAVGIPVASTAFHCSALLVSSTTSPVARGFEVWQASESGFSLVGGAYRGFDVSLALPPETTLSSGDGLPGLASQSGGAVVSEQPDIVFAGRDPTVKVPEAACGLAIPFYDGDRLSSVTNLLF